MTTKLIQKIPKMYSVADGFTIDNLMSKKVAYGNPLKSSMEYGEVQSLEVITDENGNQHIEYTVKITGELKGATKVYGSIVFEADNTIVEITSLFVPEVYNMPEV